MCLKEDQDLVQNKENILLLLVLLGEPQCSAWLEIFLSPAHLCLVLCYFVAEIVPFSVKVVKSLLGD